MDALGRTTARLTPATPTNLNERSPLSVGFCTDDPSTAAKVTSLGTSLTLVVAEFLICSGAYDEAVHDSEIQTIG